MEKPTNLGPSTRNPQPLERALVPLQILAVTEISLENEEGISFYNMLSILFTKLSHPVCIALQWILEEGVFQEKFYMFCKFSSAVVTMWLEFPCLLLLLPLLASPDAID